MKKQLLIGIAILGMTTLSTTMTSCSSTKKALKEQGYEYEDKISEMSKTKITGKYIEVGGIGLAKTHSTAKKIGSLKGKASAAEVFGTLLKLKNGEKIDNSLIDEADLEISTKEIFDAVTSESAEALLTGAYVSDVHFGRAKDGSGRIMALVRVRVPFKGSETKLQ